MFHKHSNYKEERPKYRRQREVIVDRCLTSSVTPKICIPVTDTDPRVLQRRYNLDIAIRPL
jgi:hypothetical protein